MDSPRSVTPCRCVNFRSLPLLPLLPVAASLSTGVAMAAPPGAIGPIPVTTREVSELTNFSSPSGNIGCYIEPTNVRCDIAERTWSPPPKPASCPEVVGWGQGLQLDVGRPAGFVCAGDTAFDVGQSARLRRQDRVGVDRVHQFPGRYFLLGLRTRRVVRHFA